MIDKDIWIVGGGIVGATLALMLANTTTLSIGILDRQPFFRQSKEHGRGYAINLASQRIFIKLGLWKKMKPFATPIEEIDINHGRLKFKASHIGELTLGYIIEENDIHRILVNHMTQNTPITLIAPIHLQSLIQQDEGMILKSEQGDSYYAPLFVAADGAQSWLREKAHFDLEKKQYQESAIVTTVTTKEEHHHIARQVFLESGPLALLPLPHAHETSLVWSMPSKNAEDLMQRDKKNFCEYLGKAISFWLGEVVSISDRTCFTLMKQTVKTYVKPHIALVGDAAHLIHPLAGQGINIGLLDAASLAEVLSQTDKKQLIDMRYLRRYERWRKADNVVMDKAIDFLKFFFSASYPASHALQTMGLVAMDQLSLVKKYVTNYAVGNRHNLPYFAR